MAHKLNIFLHRSSTNPIEDLLTTNSNQRTIESYNKHAEEYILHTPRAVEEHKPEMREWIDNALLSIPPIGKIFEIGSATTRDADYMRRKGYNVTCSDAAVGFLDTMKRQGEVALFFNVLEDEFPRQYDMIYANGVVSHFTPAELVRVLKNIDRGLTPRGIFAFSIKYGTGEEWIEEKFDDKRFTHYWNLEDIFDLLKKEGLEVIFDNNNIGAFPSHRWLNIVCRKIS